MNIRNVLRLGTLFSFSAIISGGLVWSVSARAASNLFSVSHSAIECKPMCGSGLPCLPPQYFGISSYSGNFGQFINLAQVPVRLACPAPTIVAATGSTNYSNPNVASYLSVQGYADATATSIAACITYGVGGGGGQCGTALTSPTSQNFNVQFDAKQLAEWTGATSNDVFWVSVIMPAVTSNGSAYANLFSYTYY
jgi:hypothetical protein